MPISWSVIRDLIRETERRSIWIAPEGELMALAVFLYALHENSHLKPRLSYNRDSIVDAHAGSL